MTSIEEVSKKFLSKKIFVVAGVSSKGDTAANIVYKKLRVQGYKVYPLNPNSELVEGDRCYPSIDRLPELPQVVVIATHPDVTPSILNECGKAGVKCVWIHRSFGQGSYHPEAETIAKLYNMTLIPGGCPMMFSEPVDAGHKCMRWFLKVTGKQAVPQLSEKI